MQHTYKATWIALTLILSSGTAFSNQSDFEEIDRKHNSCCKPCNPCCNTKTVGNCKRVAITSLPTVLKTPNTNYYLPNNLTYANKDSGHTAIKIEASNIDIDLCNHTITILPNNSTTATPSRIFLITDQDNISIHNGELKGSKPVDNTRSTDWAGIIVEGTKNIEVTDLNMKDLRGGFGVPCGNFGSTNANFFNCTFTDMYSRAFIDGDDPVCGSFIGGAIGGFKLNGLRVERTTFEQTRGSNPLGNFLPNISIGFSGDDGTEFFSRGFVNNAFISNCSFIKTDAAILYNPAGDTHGTLLVENCSFLTPLDANYGRVVQMCCALPDCRCRSEIIRNCVFKYDLGDNESYEVAPGPVCIFIPSGQAVLVENCAFSAPKNLRTILIGTSAVDNFYDNCTIRECLFQGEAERHIWAQDGRGLLVQDCQLSNAQYGVYINAVTNADIPAEVIVDNTKFVNICGVGVKVVEGTNGAVTATGTIVRDSIFKRCGIGVQAPEDSATWLINNYFHLNGVQYDVPALGNFFTPDPNISTITEVQPPCN